jgi:hypothetical protein
MYFGSHQNFWEKMWKNAENVDRNPPPDLPGCILISEEFYHPQS